MGISMSVVARPATTDILIPKKNRVDIYSYLFKEGVICAKNDWGKPKHDELDVPNMHGLKLMQSLCSRNLVKNQYSWQWQYYYLTDEGVEYLRDYLHLPPEIVPATLKKASRPQADGFRGGGKGFGKGGDDKKPGGPGEGFNPDFLAA